MRFDPHEFITLLPMRPALLARYAFATVAVGGLIGVIIGWALYLCGMDPVH